MRVALGQLIGKELPLLQLRQVGAACVRGLIATRTLVLQLRHRWDIVMSTMLALAL